MPPLARFLGDLSDLAVAFTTVPFAVRLFSSLASFANLAVKLYFFLRGLASLAVKLYGLGTTAGYLRRR
jgi:hypothetical protein